MQAPTPAQIEEQVEHERDAIRQGLKRLRENTKKLEQKDYASASVYGVCTIEQLLPLVIEQIEQTNNRIHEGRVGQSFKEIDKYLKDVEPLAAAAIACKVTVDKVFSYKDSSNQLVNVTESIGQALESECQMRHYEQHAPGLLQTLKKNYWHKSCGTHQKVVVIQTLMNRYEVQQWQTWGRTNRIKLGSWLLDCILEASHWFEKETRQQGRKRVNYLVPTPQFMAIKDEVMCNAELFSPLAWPMLIKPNDWSNEKPGGYILNEVMNGHDMVRRSGQPCIQGEQPIAALNKIQSVAYTLNPFTVDVSEQLQRQQISVGKFKPIVNHDEPPKPFDIAENSESRHAWKKAVTEIRNLNAQEFRRSCRTRMTMDTLKLFKNKERFYCPHSFDYRSRIYPIPAFLSFQDTDWGKSLLRFADEAFMDDQAEQWLRFQLATTYGLDKETLEDRLHWTHENEYLAHRIATNPIGYLSDWEGAEEPWQFLAACDEFYHCVVKRDRLSTGLPIAIDATCSGLQILAGLAKDKSTADLVNVTNSDKPQDAYAAVAEASKPHIPERLRHKWDRKKLKRTVMTIPYNAKPFSNRDYIRDALKEDGIEVTKEELTETVQAVREAMNTIVPGPMKVMKWIESEVGKAIKRGAEYIEWVTPAGFTVHQKLNKHKVEILKLQLLGKVCKYSVSTGDSKEVDLSRHKAATAPNLIHSLDASLLSFTVLKFNAPIALIHDSVLCRATDMTELSRIVRETYMHLFAEHDYLTVFASQIGAETEPPIIGDLKPESVIESTYFFC